MSSLSIQAHPVPPSATSAKGQSTSNKPAAYVFIVIDRFQLIGCEDENTFGNPVNLVNDFSISKKLENANSRLLAGSTTTTTTISSSNTNNPEADILYTQQNISEPLLDMKRPSSSSIQNDQPVKKRYAEYQYSLHRTFGWQDLHEITFHDCIIPADQEKLLNSDDSWYRPSSSVAIINESRQSQQQSSLSTAAANGSAVQCLKSPSRKMSLDLRMPPPASSNSDEAGMSISQLEMAIHAYKNIQ